MMCFLSLLLDVFVKDSQLHLVASLHNFDERSPRLFEISSRNRHHQNHCSTTILKPSPLGVYIQILLELRLLVPLDHTICSVNLVGNGNISVPFIIHLCKLLVELHWSFPSSRVSLQSSWLVFLCTFLERRKPRCWTFH